jgi:5'(3')-deoxyribonucleotidase
MGKSSENQREITLSQYPVTFVQFVFAVVIGASVLYFHEFLFPPNLASLNFWALVIAYFTAITSWFGWRESTPKYPYTDSGIGRVRSVLDAAIVVAYVALLFFGSRIDKLLGWYLWGLVIIFLLYFVVGKLRQTEHHDYEASQSSLIAYHGVALVVVAVVYTALSSMWIQFPLAATWVFVLIPAGPVASYRWFRDWRKLPWIKRTKRRITIAVDMDGVLVEQVVPVLQKLKKEIGVDLCKCDITEWEYPIDNTDIKSEIERAEREEQFVREMPPMKNASEALHILSREYKIVIATSRESSTDRWSRVWLHNHSMKYSRFINTRMHGKNLCDADVLIDDYMDNIQEFIRNGPPGRQAILSAQPWNHDPGAISDLISSGKVKIAHSWSTVLAILGCRLI